MKCIDRTFNILELFFDADNELSVNTLSRLSGLSPAVVHRIVVSLSEKGYLTQKEKRGKYSLGFKFLKFCYNVAQEKYDTADTVTCRPPFATASAMFR